ncbi:hypothetical protein E4U46_001281, partial [Claviceps purpurea]
YPSPTSIHLRQVSISDKYPSPTSIISHRRTCPRTPRRSAGDVPISRLPSISHRGILDFGYFLLRCSYLRRT